MPTRRLAACVFVIVVGSTLFGAPTAARAEEADLPTFEVVKGAVEGYFKGTGEEPSKNRLLVRKDVEPVFPMLEKLGWKVGPSKEISGRYLQGNDPLVQELRRPGAAAFAKKIANYPNVYDRLDQLRGMPYGMRRIREFATTPGGETMLKYMTTTPGGKEMSRQLQRARGGRDFGKPTGRLYTSADLVAALKTEYDAEVARREKLEGRRRPVKAPAGTPKQSTTRFPTSRVGFAKR